MRKHQLNNPVKTNTYLFKGTDPNNYNLLNNPVKTNTYLFKGTDPNNFGACVGQQDAFGTGRVLGRCAEFRAANTLARFGAKVKNIRWTLAYDVNKGANGFIERGSWRKYCDVCTTIHNINN